MLSSKGIHFMSETPIFMKTPSMRSSNSFGSSLRSIEVQTFMLLSSRQGLHLVMIVITHLGTGHVAPSVNSGLTSGLIGVSIQF